MKKRNIDYVTKDVPKETAKADVCVYSKLLKQPFDTMEELNKAEDAYREAHKAELAKKEERQADLALIKTSASNYFDIVKKNEEVRKKMREEELHAYNEYKSKLDDFAEKHNGYHLTYYRDGDNVEFNIEENHHNSVINYFEEQRENMKRFFDSFWRW